MKSGRRILVRERLSEAQNHRCCYCGVRMDGNAATSPIAPTLEHVQARAHGGRNRLSNLVVACSGCNCSRGTKSAMKYFKARSREICA